MNEQGTLNVTAPRAVLDTNTVLDMLLFEDAAALPLVHAIESAALRWVGTARMREEVAGVLRRPRMGRWAPPERADRVLVFLDRWMQCFPAPLGPQAPRCRDTADQVFIDLAWSLSTEWLLTRDKALLKLARPSLARGIQVRTPAAWVAAIANHHAAAGVKG